jgi:hypothetical protein
MNEGNERNVQNEDKDHRTEERAFSFSRNLRH